MCSKGSENINKERIFNSITLKHEVCYINTTKALIVVLYLIKMNLF